MSKDCLDAGKWLHALESESLSLQLRLHENINVQLQGSAAFVTNSATDPSLGLKVVEQHKCKPTHVLLADPSFTDATRRVLFRRVVI